MQRRPNSFILLDGAKKIQPVKQPSSAVQEPAPELAVKVAHEADTPESPAPQKAAFADPRVTPDRRLKSSIFFSGFRDRRVKNRRHSCTMNGKNWWMLRDYSSSS